MSSQPESSNLNLLLKILKKFLEINSLYVYEMSISSKITFIFTNIVM